MTKKTRWYTMTVLAYYRSEWTDVPDDDKSYRLLVTEELQQLIKTCMKRGVSVPNAAKEVEIFLDLQEARDEASIDRMVDFDIKSTTKPRGADDGNDA
jgi:hypothetical protein